MRVGRLSWCFALSLLAAGQVMAQCRVEGLVRAEDGTPLAGATVRLEIPDQRVPLTTTVGPDGRFKVENVKAGSRAHVVVVQDGRLVAEAYALVTQWVETIDVVSRAVNTKVTGDWDLDPGGGPSGSVVGIVRTATGTPIPAARVSVRDTTMTATSDSAGRFALPTLRSGVSVDLDATAPGFKAATTQLLVPNDGRQDANFTLQAADSRTDTGPNLSPLYSADDNDRVGAKAAQVAGVPSLGRRDLFRALQFLPGVSATLEPSGELSVRGGNPGESLVSLDGFTLYPVVRPYGPFSALNTDAVGGVEFSKTAMDASDGGRLGGVVRLSGRSNDDGHATGSVDFSLLGTRAVLSTPLGSHARLLVAGRRSFTGSLNDRILDVLADDGTPASRTRVGRYSGGLFTLPATSMFRDLNGKLEADLDAKDRLAVSFYDAAEDANNPRDLSLLHNTSIGAPSLYTFPSTAVAQLSDLQKWTARGMSASWTRRWTPSASTTVSVGRSKTSVNGARSSMLTSPGDAADYSFIAGRGGSAALSDTNTIDDTTVRLVNAITTGFSHAFSFGGEITTIDAAYALQGEALRRGSSTVSSLAPLYSHTATARLSSAFLQDSWRPFAKLTLAPGVRVVHDDLAAVTYLEPRASANLQVAPRFHVKAGWSIDHQEVNRLTYEDRMQGDREFWMLADGSSIPVPRSQQATAGWSIDLPGFVLDVQGYYRRLEDLTMVAPRLFPGTAPDFTTRLFHYGTGTAKGVEVLAHQQWERDTLWIGYTVGKTSYTFPTLEASAFPSSQDQLQEVKVANSLQLASRWWLGTSWVIGSGRPYTPAIGVGAVWFPTGVALTQVAFGAKNSSRLPIYHRLDLSSEREFRLGWFRSTLGVSVFNVYNRKNAAERLYTMSPGVVTTTDLTAMGRVVNAFLRVGF
jgi:ferric enterobactin receptor